MRRCLGALSLLAAAGCAKGPPYALVNITTPAGLPSACVVLEMTADDLRSPFRKVVLREPQQDAFRVAVFQEDWPTTATLQAYVPASCSDLLVKLARSPMKDVTFSPSPPEIDLDIPDPSPASLAFVDDLLPQETGACSPPLQLEVRDAQGAPALVPSLITASFTTEPSTGLEVFTDGACATPVGSALIGPAPSVLVRVRGGSPGSKVLRATAPGLAPAVTTVQVLGGPPTSLVVTSAPQTVLAGDCSAAVMLELRDAAGLPATAPSPLALDLQLPNAFATFYSDPACTMPLTSPSIPLGSGQATAYFRPYTPSAPGTWTLSATAGTLAPGTQAVTVVPIVRRGSCLLPATLTTTQCTVNPPPVSRDRAFFFFQATNNNPNPHDAQVRCALADPPNLINCYRYGSGGDVLITWSVVELAYASVQHVDLDCTSSPGLARLNLPRPVNLDEAFLLFSVAPEGYDYRDDFRATYFDDGGAGVFFENGSSNCINNWTYTAQAVELAGASVDRGIAATDAGLITISGLSTVDPSRSFLLYSWSAATGGPIICDRMVMGEMDSNTSLRFSLGNGNAACPTQVIKVSWERVEMRLGIVESPTVTMSSGELVKNVSLTNFYNNSRTVAFSGGQATGGQGGGQSAFTGDDLAAEAIARHSLTGGNGLRLTRDVADAGSKWRPYVVEFEP